MYASLGNFPLTHLASVIGVKNKALIKAIGENIHKLRKERGLTQTELSHEADIILSQVARIERGETNPTISTLYVIAEALGVDLKDLVNIKFKK